MPEPRRATAPLAATFERLRAEDRTAFIPFVTAGHPSPELVPAVLAMLEEEGADVIEFGVPFSDPLADGPTIQAATWTALRQGVTLEQVLEWTGRFTERSRVPLVLFSYLNPILQYGPERFARRACEAGAAGILVTDLPAGADANLESALRSTGLDLVRLIAPTTTRERAARVIEGAGGFIYYISRRGVTGERSAVREQLADELEALRQMTDLPIAVGFGISSAEQAARVARLADGVVVGSALVRTLDEEGLDAARRLARELKRGIDGPIG